VTCKQYGEDNENYDATCVNGKLYGSEEIIVQHEIKTGRGDQDK
jgi:hypothetical protein